MMTLLLFILAAIAMIVSLRKPGDPLAFIRTSVEKTTTATGTSAVNMSLLTDEPFKARLRFAMINTMERLGKYAKVKLVLFVVLVAAASIYLHRYLPNVPFPALAFSILLGSSFALAWWLKSREKKHFDSAFPDALNMLTGAISSGESLMHSIIFVGESMQGVVGNEFKLMGQRLSLGQSPDEVLHKACHRFPYPAFFFFAIALRANVNRGGQLKEIIKNLSKVLFDNQALAKKKSAMTSEARISAKIVAAIPFSFLFLMKFMSPDNFDFVMYQDAGQPILYYLLISESIGLGIIWFLMKRIER